MDTAPLREPPASLRVPPAPRPVAALVHDSPPLAHVSADLIGVRSGPLRDVALLSGLLIAAAGAAGLNAIGAPVVHHAPPERSRPCFSSTRVM
jgi:hypothetical protein